MTHTTADYADIADFGAKRATAPAVPQTSLFRRVADGLAQARRRRNGREVAQFIQAHGGHLTDELEREISRRFGHMAGEL